MRCENTSTTFESVLTKDGYWMDKDYYNLCNRGTGELDAAFRPYRRDPCTAAFWRVCA